MIERVALGFKERKELEKCFDAFDECVSKEDFSSVKGIIQKLNKLLKEIGWVGAFCEKPFKILDHRGVAEEVRGVLIFAPQSILQEDLVNTSKLESAHGFYVCFAPLRHREYRHSFVITCGVQNLKEAQACPAFKKLFENDKAKYHSKCGEKICIDYRRYLNRYALNFLRLVALFDDLPVQDFKVGGASSRQAFPRKADVFFLRGVQAHAKEYIDEAIECYEKSAKLGDVESFYELGKIYGNTPRWQFVKGCPNFTKAIACLKKAGEMGDTRSYKILGGFYLNGKGGTKDVEKGLEYLNLAADMGSVEAGLRLADFYLEEDAPHKDPKKAEDYYNKALNKALKMGQTKLEKARICYKLFRKCMGYSNVVGSIGLHKKALAHYKKAVSLAEEVFGAEVYARMVNMGWAEYDKTQILEWCLKAIELGDTRFYSNVAEMYVTGEGCVKDEQKALEYFNKAIEVNAKDYTAHFYLAELYFDGGDVVEQDYAKALEHFTIVANGASRADLFYGDTFRRLSQIYDKGLGVAPDPLKAFEYLKKACGMGEWGD
ncbi:tetratricopeptide repeat protein [Helicobacter bizzozeronii]|uniref:tetratricopeptide repeat protein n=1 Tax=Helicobacter bizzozeronii TaxID=56877 RepID=UPI000CF0C725|nr:SEL1-like repeat protein [Helicobacter bizzozeronii]